MNAEEKDKESSSAVPISGDLLAPIVEYIRVNDTDTMSQCYPDSTIVATASGSWTGTAHITLGDLRRIAAAVRKHTSALGASEEAAGKPEADSKEVIHIVGQHLNDGTNSRMKTASGWVEYQNGGEGDPFLSED